MLGQKTLGSSLHVPHVQDLAASLGGSSEIPERYIRPEVEADPVADYGDCFNIPVIDLGRCQLSLEESSKIGLACEEWGFFQLINHGVPGELMEKMKEDIVEFFKLPTEDKKAFEQLPNNFEGYGQMFVKSDHQKLDWGDMLALKTLPQDKRIMRFWPTHPPTFWETLDAYASALKEVTYCLLKLIADHLKIDTEIIMSNFKEMQQAVRINYYPPCPQAEKAIGLSPHSDATGLTILLQTSDVQGLQIRYNGKWLPVKPLPGAFIVNVGDLLEIFSNGKYKSVEHRVVVNTEKDRLSIAAFHAPHPSCILRPFPQLVQGGFENYRATSGEEYMKAYFFAKLSGKNHLETLKVRN